MPILVILESPSKEAKVQKYLGNEYIVKSSKGHLRDLDKSKLSIDIDNNFNPKYIINSDKKNVIDNLKSINKKCSSVLLACDYDREGESIAWHLSEILKIKPVQRKRLLFTEITEKAIQKSIKDIKPLNMDMFYAQQARRVIDRLIGYIITPLLWNNIQNSMKKGISLSAGRVQSVVNKLIIERENEIEKFSSNSYYKTCGDFIYNNIKINGELNEKIEEKEIIDIFLEDAAEAQFIIKDIKKSNSTKNASQPFITSSLQQEVSNKFKISPKSTMMIAQKLYENGLITYMRTDSVTMSDEILINIESYIKKKYGDKYSKKTQYKNKGKNAQEAHECIRPCNINLIDLESLKNDKFNASDVKIYNLIWKRTIASQMSPCNLENLNIYIGIHDLDANKSNKTHKLFIAKNQKILFDGFTILYTSYEDIEETDETDTNKNNSKYDILSKLKIKTIVNMKKIISTEKFTKPSHLRFTEASLIKKLDELGIGRPSTYSTMVSTVQDRNYVLKKDITGKKCNYNILKLENFTIEEEVKSIELNSEKQKLVPTQIGLIVNEFLNKNFSNILNYNFTSNIESQLDDVALGKKQCNNVVSDCYKSFINIVENLKKTPSLDKNNYSKLIGVDPNTKFEIYAYIGKYGPCVQLKNTTDLSKTKYAPIKDIKIEDITLNKAIELLKYPYIFGQYNKKNITISKGKYGIYFKYNDKNYSLSYIDENTLTLDILKNIIEKPTNSSTGNNSDESNNNGSYKSNIIRTINKDIIIKSGKYGPYICFKEKTNVKIYSKKKIEELTIDDCNAMIDKYNTFKSKKK